MYRYIYITSFALIVTAWTQSAPARAALMQMEAGTVTVQNTLVTPGFTSVTFTNEFRSTPLVFSLATNQGAQPSALRIRNVSSTGFEIISAEPPNLDGGHAAMTTAYFAIEPGVTTLPDGTIFEAGLLDTVTSVQRSAPFPNVGGFDTVNFATNFGAAEPAVLAQIQTMHNEASSPALPNGPSTPWMTASVSSIGTTSVDLALGRAEVNDNADGDGNPNNDIVIPETIGYVAISSGSGSFNLAGTGDILFDAFQTADVITGFGTGVSVPFNQSFGAAPLLVGTIGSRDGIDGGWLRRGTLTSGGVNLMVDEDQFRDSERFHTTEIASLLAFSSPFSLVTVPEPAATSLAMMALFVLGFHRNTAARCARRRRASTAQRGD